MPNAAIVAAPQSAFRALGQCAEWYAAHARAHPYLTGAATATAAFVGGDCVAGLIAGGAPFQPARMGVLAGLGLFYAWETPQINAAIERDIPAAGKVRRTLCYAVGYSSLWTVRHMAIMDALHGTGGTSVDLVAQGIAVWSGAIVPTLGLGYCVQNWLPLRLRFLAQAAITAVWQIGASLMRMA